jgi:hypothetical protein
MAEARLAERRLDAREGLFALGLLGFSAWLMFRSFSYDAETQRMLVSVKVWSDFAANLPLIRSFSLGDNWPPEYPIYPGQPIQYHYFFYLLVGLLERAGVPLHWALNVPSALGFFLVLWTTYLIARRLFGDRRVGVLSVAFLLLNGSLGFLEFFEKHPPLSTTLAQLLESSDFTAMGPWDGGPVLGVWHLNVFINQRHFCLSLGILLAFLLVCIRLGTGPGVGADAPRRRLGQALLFGVLIGLFPVLHRAVLLIFAVAMSVLFLAVPRLRGFLVVVGATSVAVMAALWAASFYVVTGTGGLGWYPGFAIHDTLGVASAARFFWHQFGVHCVLIPLGFLVAPREARIYALPAFLVAGIAFLFKFADEVLVGHKFFNFFLIVGQMFSACAIVRLYDALRRSFWEGRARLGPALAVAPLVVFATLSGVLDLFPIVNMGMAEIPDVGSNPDARWFAEHTERDAVVLTSGTLYTAPSIAGRKIFVGWGYFTDSAGYDTKARLAIRQEIYAGRDVHVVCGLLRKHNVSYVEVEELPEGGDGPRIDVAFFRQHFVPAYASRNGRYAVYATKAMCGAGL